jgi:hypothetical protein
VSSGAALAAVFALRTLSNCKGFSARAAVPHPKSPFGACPTFCATFPFGSACHFRRPKIAETSFLTNKDGQKVQFCETKKDALKLAKMEFMSPLLYLCYSGTNF